MGQSQWAAYMLLRVSGRSISPLNGHTGQRGRHRLEAGTNGGDRGDRSSSGASGERQQPRHLTTTATERHFSQWYTVYGREQRQWGELIEQWFKPGKELLLNRRRRGRATEERYGGFRCPRKAEGASRIGLARPVVGWAS